MLILLAASALAASVGEVTDASIIAITVLLGAALDAFQTSRSSAAVERLRQSVDSDGDRLARRSLVGDRAARSSARRRHSPVRRRRGPSRRAAGVEPRSHVQQAALTGESFPAEKEAIPADGRRARHAPTTTDPNQVDAVFLGTSVVSGVGIGVVSTTGMRTAFGEIAARLRDAPPPTEIERGLRRFGALLAQTVMFLVLFLVLVSVALHRDPLESLLFAVALAVGVVPEFMPMVTSITLATGAVRMARQRVIVKHLAAIHNFGSIDMLCSDKTGTLTRGEMQLEAATERQAGASARVLRAGRASPRTFRAAFSNPLDDAILARPPRRPTLEKLDEIPFDFERRRMSVVVVRRRRHDGHGRERRARARALRLHDVFRGDESQPLDDDDARRRRRRQCPANGSRGFRTLAVA